MATLHDDLPHPVPPLAFLRWKENYFFIIIDPSNDLYGVSHLNFEPGFNRARFSCNISIQGKLYKYGSEVSFPENFAFSTELTDGKLKLVIDGKMQAFQLSLASDELDVNLVFSKRMPEFDFNACSYAAPDLTSFKEAMTLGTNLPFEHFQQAMKISGSVTLLENKKQVDVDCLGYRDHSWCMRSDNIVRSHTWCGLNFPSISFGVMTIEMLARPGSFAKEGYVVDGDGARALRAIEVEMVGQSDDFLPSTVIHKLTDVFGREYRIESDIANRLGVVPLDAEKPDGGVAYKIAENFCRSKLEGSDELGLSLVEIGITP